MKHYNVCAKEIALKVSWSLAYNLVRVARVVLTVYKSVMYLANAIIVIAYARFKGCLYKVVHH